ncbi:MAG: hypothetical protein JST93_35205 [Acidobacteria bacterium]|nr:hypothetical protein [Acidobacteriota bacterium]
MSKLPRAAINGSRMALPVLLLAIVVLVSMALAEGGGNVMPATAKPHGYSLDDMTLKMALFQTSGNAPAYYPQTPFQVLYMNFAAGPPAMSEISCPAPNGGTGALFSGANSFVVRPGTPFFVPLWSVTDSPPVLPPFPSHASLAGHYMFDVSLVGGRDFEVIVDGQSTKLGERYAGWAMTPASQPLPDGGGHGIVIVGAFLTPMSVGTHMVTIKGQLAGAGLLSYFGINCMAEDYSYLVKVVQR